MNLQSDKAVSIFREILKELKQSKDITTDIGSDKLINIALELTKSTLIASSIDNLGDNLRLLPEMWNFDNFRLPLHVEVENSKKGNSRK
ncbi:MAG: hypothetical protein AAF378_21915 [Cyanobacteria bacterium P01_A01_bin.84]